MISKTSILLFFAALSLTTALPTPETLEPRICGSVILPSTLIQLKADQPDTSFPNTVHTDNSFYVYQDVNGATGMLFSFFPQSSFPPNFTSISLRLPFPPQTENISTRTHVIYPFSPINIPSRTSRRQSQPTCLLHRPRRRLWLYPRHHLPLRIHLPNLHRRRTHPRYLHSSRATPCVPNIQ